MPATLFISDLHLSPARPHLVAAFHALLHGPARAAASVYVLGDLFDVWLGDDQLRQPLAAAVVDALAELAGSGVPLFVQRGNRDFLLGERFARTARATLLPDRVVHDIQGTRTLLMHGDLLCTDDGRTPHAGVACCRGRISCAEWLRRSCALAAVARPQPRMK